MAKQVLWNKIVYDEFCLLADLSDEEKKILKTRIQGWTITKQAMYFNMSISSVNRTISRLKAKYDSVQPYSKLLPPRKFSVKETYMDNH